MLRFAQKKSPSQSKTQPDKNAKLCICISTPPIHSDPSNNAFPNPRRQCPHVQHDGTKRNEMQPTPPPSEPTNPQTTKKSSPISHIPTPSLSLLPTPTPPPPLSPALPRTRHLPPTSLTPSSHNLQSRQRRLRRRRPRRRILRPTTINVTLSAPAHRLAKPAVARLGQA